MTPEPEHWSADEAYHLDPKQELETIELGDRVGWWLTMWMMAAAYSTQESRESQAVLVLAGCVAEATSHRGLPYPAEWWPTQYGPVGV